MSLLDRSNNFSEEISLSENITGVDNNEDDFLVNNETQMDTILNPAKINQVGVLTSNNLENLIVEEEIETRDLESNFSSSKTDNIYILDADPTDSLENMETEKEKGAEEIEETSSSRSTSDESSDEDYFATKPGQKRKRKQYLHAKVERDNIKRTKNIQKHAVKPPCKKCKKKCSEKICQNRRLEINNKYWKMGFEAQKTFISSMCQESEIKRRRSTTNKENFKKCISNSFFLKNTEGTLVQVCKVFFLELWGIKEIMVHF